MHNFIREPKMRAGRILRQSSVVNALRSPIVEVACPEALEGPSLTCPPKPWRRRKAWISVDWKKLILFSLALLNAPHIQAMKADEPDSLVHLFLHDQPRFGQIYGPVPADVKRLLALHTLHKLPLESWVLQKLKLPTFESQFLSDPMPSEQGEAPPTTHSTVALFSDPGNLIAIGTDKGDVRLFDRTNNSWRRLIATRHQIESLQFLDERFLRAIDEGGDSRIWDLHKVRASTVVPFPLENVPEEATFPQAPDLRTGHMDDTACLETKVQSYQLIQDCRVNAQGTLRFIAIFPKREHAERNFLRQLTHWVEYTPEIQIRGYATNQLLQRIPVEGLLSPLAVHSRTNTLLARKRFWDGEKLVLFDLTELSEMHNYFQKQIRLEQVLLLSVLYQMARHKIKLDFNKFPELWPYYQSLPEPIKKALKKLIICHGESSCTIL